MPDFLVSRSGQINAEGGDRELFLKVFGGEVMTAFRPQDRVRRAPSCASDRPR